MKLFLLCMLYSVRIGAMAQANTLSLITNRSSKYVVTIDKNPSFQEDRAASIFRYYIKKVTSVNLPISGSNTFEFAINILEDTTLASGGFYIYSKGNSLIISGGKENGVINGVLYVLKKYCEIDFLSVDNVYMPSSATILIKVPVNVKQSPSFVTRMFHSAEGYDYDYVETHSLQVPFLENNAFKHTFNIDLLPPNVYYKSHPEYYSFYKGRRDTSQPNLLHPDVFNIVMQKVRTKIKQDTGGKIKYYDINLNDNPVISDDAETSRAIATKQGNYTSVYLNFVNKIARSFPKYQFTVLAYEQTKAVPDNVSPEKNVNVILTNADNNKSKPLFTDDYDIQQGIHMKREIPLWLSKDAGLTFWDYIANYTNSIMPWPNLYTIKPNLKYYKQLGIKNIFLQGAGLFTAENSELKAYLCANLMWNVEYDDDSLIQNFCQKFYRLSGKTMYQYIKEINRLSLQGSDKLYTYDGPTKFEKTLFSYNNVKRWLTILRDIEKNAENNLIRTRITKERLGIECVYIENSLAVAGWNNVDTNSSLLKQINQFQTDAVRIGISKVSEAVPALSDYILQLQAKLKNRSAR